MHRYMLEPEQAISTQSNRLTPAPIGLRAALSVHSSAQDAGYAMDDLVSENSIPTLSAKIIARPGAVAPLPVSSSPSPIQAWSDISEENASQTEFSPLSSTLVEEANQQAQQLAQAEETIARLRAELEAEKAERAAEHAAMSHELVMAQEEAQYEKEVYKQALSCVVPVGHARQVKTYRRPIGKGAFGEVKRGVYTDSQGTEHPVAVKQWTGLSFGEKEVDIHIQLAHENVVKVIAMLAYPVYSLVLELADGTLADYLDASASGAAYHIYPDRVRIAVELAAGLCYLHEVAKVIHRDIKPENVLLYGGRPKWSDFGLASEIDDRGVAISGPHDVGTPGYAAPEQVSGRESSVKSDSFAFGRLLHELLCGHLICVSNQDIRTMAAQGAVYDANLPYSDPTKVSHLTSRYALYGTVKVCGALDPQNRLTAPEIYEELEEAMSLCSTP